MKQPTDLNWNGVFSFWLVAKCGSFAEAARRSQGGSVQGLHKRVRQLEGHSGIRLKLLQSRGVKGVALTEAGRQLHALIDPMFSTFELMVSELRHENAGPLRLATTALGAHNYLPLILAGFRNEFPGVTVSVRVRSEAEAIGLAENGLVDIVIAAAPKQASCLKVTARTRIAFQLVAPAGYPWPAATLTWPHVVTLPLIVPERVSGIRVSLEELLASRRLLDRLRISAEVTTSELAIELVRGGYGVALVPDAPRLAATLGDLSIVEVPPGLEEKSIAVMHREDLYLPRYMKRFKELATSVICQGISPFEVMATTAQKR
ncbi:MAG: LysR family transcriptional regulator [Acidobacteriota bacterium]|jgi:DNA-binding transcriptional LysR family regulator